MNVYHLDPTVRLVLMADAISGAISPEALKVGSPELYQMVQELKWADYLLQVPFLTAPPVTMPPPMAATHWKCARCQNEFPLGTKFFIPMVGPYQNKRICTTKCQPPSSTVTSGAFVTGALAK